MFNTETNLKNQDKTNYLKALSIIYLSKMSKDLRWRSLARVVIRPRSEDCEFVLEVAHFGLQRVPLLQDVAQLGKRKPGPGIEIKVGHLTWRRAMV